MTSGNHLGSDDRTVRLHKCVIVDDHPVVREGLRLRLRAITELEVVGEAENGKAAIELIAQHDPDIAIVDLSMPGLNGTEAIEEMKRRKPQIKIVVLTLHKNETYLRASLDAGADAYVLKDDSREAFLLAVTGVMEGKKYVSPGVCELLVNNYINRPNPTISTGNAELGTEPERNDSQSPNQSWLNLTLREREVLKLLAEGLRNKEIGRFLSISPKTVEKHRYNVLRKLGLRNVSDLTAYAIANGLVER